MNQQELEEALAFDANWKEAQKRLAEEKEFDQVKPEQGE